MLSKNQLRGAGVAAIPLLIVLVLCLLFGDLRNGLWEHVNERGLLQCGVAVVFILFVGGCFGHAWDAARSPAADSTAAGK